MNKIKKFFTNRWVKIGGGVLLATGATLLTVHLVKKARDKKALNNNDGVFDNSLIPEIVDNANFTPVGFQKMERGGVVVNYNSTAVAVGDFTYTFTKDGVKKMQKYFAKNPAAKKMIEDKGGYDGIIGETFASILATVLKPTGSVVNVKQRIESSMPSVIKSANIGTGEVKITRTTV